METIFDSYLTFPASDWVEKEFDKLTKLSTCVEGVEIDFDIDLSCGDGKFLPDLEDTPEELEYDGKVCLKSVPRFRDTKELFKPNKDYRFTIKVYGEDDDEEIRFYINGKERSRRNDY
jgi:hypothetical protein